MGVMISIFTLSCCATPNKALDHLKQLQTKSIKLIKSTRLDLLSCISGACCMGAVLLFLSAMRERKLKIVIDDYVRRSESKKLSEQQIVDQMPALETSEINIMATESSSTDRIIAALAQCIERGMLKQEQSIVATYNSEIKSLDDLSWPHSIKSETEILLSKEDNDALIDAEIEQQLREEEARKNYVE